MPSSSPQTMMNSLPCSSSLLRFRGFSGEGARPVLPCWGSCWAEKAFVAYQLPVLDCCDGGVQGSGI